ncbi:MAG: hypothetical protein ACFCUX_05425 [Candidatus Methylacidiphilales bacterium]
MAQFDTTTFKGQRLDRSDFWLWCKWFPLMLVAFWILFVTYHWTDQGHLLGGAAVLADGLGKFLDFSYTWTLAMVGALLVVAARRHAYPLVVGLVSMAFYIRHAPVFALYFLVVTLAMYPLTRWRWRGRGVVFWLLLALFTLGLPKWLYHEAYHFPGWWGWLDDIGLTGLLLRYAYYDYEIRKGIITPVGYFEHLGYMAFIPQITANLNFSPSAQWKDAGNYPAVYTRAWKLYALALGKVLVFKLMSLHRPDVWSSESGVVVIWAGAIWLHIQWFLWLSLHYDLSIAFCRFLGADLPQNFRYPLLAPSFIEQWRRWNIFNRKLLLKLIYFPLGGSTRHRFRNVLIVFLASAVVLHSGWFATKWPTVNLEYALAWILYALCMAAGVCWNMWNRDRLGLDARYVPTGWTYVRSWLVTQLLLAWLSLLVMGTGCMPGDTRVPLDQRLATLARAVGWR